MKVLGIACGRRMSNTEIMVKEALMGAEEAPARLHHQALHGLQLVRDRPHGASRLWHAHHQRRRLRLHRRVTVGTTDEVRAYCKDLIDTMGRDGGFILGTSGQTEDVNTENV